MRDASLERERMVASQIRARGIRDPAVLAAMRWVPREAFVSPAMAEFALQDSALPIESGQTISQPFVVALMAEALELKPSDRVLEVGTGSGYAAAVLARCAGEVYTIERHRELYELASRRLAGLGLENVHVLHGDGTLGWPGHAPFDAVVVAAGAPRVPPALLEQLAPGGRLVIPVGGEQTVQSLLRIRRVAGDRFETETLDAVRFVPLVGEQGWSPSTRNPGPPSPWRAGAREGGLAALLSEVAEPIPSLDAPDLGPLIERIGDSRLVLIGDASHGTSEFYRFREQLTRQLIERAGFELVCLEADWPDAARIHDYVQGRTPAEGGDWEAFARFPAWMWRNREVLEFVEWLREYNLERRGRRPMVGVYGLDLYSLYTSIRRILEYLDDVDPQAARAARIRYGCLTPWESDPATYGHAAITGRYRICEREAVAALKDLLARRLEYAQQDGARFLDAALNARLVADAERYYRVMYYGGHDSWNLRDTHMFDTLAHALDFHGPSSRAVLWEHNSHLGDAAATEPGQRGQINVGRLCRQRFGPAAYLIGCGTDRGTVAAADDWDAPMRIKDVRPSHPRSYERLFHDAGLGAGLVHLREPRREEVRAELLPPRLERAIGVVYRPDTELQSHYFEACLPRQFDEYAWFDVTRAVSPIGSRQAAGLHGDHPFALRHARL
ncbi:MAG TPA: protein-L-isoaspartate(D-aspartate) O-methyltransferase [Planctomycetota bacterium]|nr:protein-L-isoaspartate(D-aspartate) O-methyltransferase [Planctomycetota bacterium]